MKPLLYLVLVVSSLTALSTWAGEDCTAKSLNYDQKFQCYRQEELSLLRDRKGMLPDGRRMRKADVTEPGCNTVIGTLLSPIKWLDGDPDFCIRQNAAYDARLSYLAAKEAATADRRQSDQKTIKKPQGRSESYPGDGAAAPPLHEGQSGGSAR